MSDQNIEIRLKGDGVRPGLIRSHEIADILKAIEDIVTSESLAMDPSIKKDEVVVGLYEIADASLGLRFKSSLGGLAMTAFIATSEAIACSNYASLTPQTLKALETISNFTRKHNATAELKATGTNQVFAEIRPETTIPKSISISGTTELIAKVLRVGGKSPRAMLELNDGSIIYCDIPVEIAIELGHRLYEPVIFSGEATWNAGSFEVEEFKVYGFKEMPTRNPLDALAEIRNLIGNKISIQDAVEFTSLLRRDGDIN